MVTHRWMVVWLFTVLTVDSASSQSYGGGSSDYNYDYDQSYHEEESYKRKCYGCEYGMEGEDVVGSEECGWNFEPEDLPQSSCEGSCAIELITSKDDPEHHFMIHRYCLKNCQEVNNSSRRVQCCRSDLCNHGRFRSAHSRASPRHRPTPPWIFVLPLILARPILRARLGE